MAARVSFRYVASVCVAFASAATSTSTHPSVGVRSSSSEASHVGITVSKGGFADAELDERPVRRVKANAPVAMVHSPRAVIAMAETPGYSTVGTVGYYCKRLAEAYAQKWGHDFYMGTVADPAEAPKKNSTGDPLYSWLKIPVIQAKLKNYEYVLALDTDACILDMDFDFLQLTRPGVDCVGGADGFERQMNSPFVKDSGLFQIKPDIRSAGFGKFPDEVFTWGSKAPFGPMINAGALIFRSTETGRKFVDEWWETRHEEWVTTKGWGFDLMEQAGLNKLLFSSDPYYAQRACSLDTAEFSTAWHPEIKGIQVVPPMPEGKSRKLPFVAHMNGGFYKKSKPIVAKHLLCTIQSDDCEVSLVQAKHVLCQVLNECHEFEQWQIRYSSLLFSESEKSSLMFSDIAMAL